MPTIKFCPVSGHTLIEREAAGRLRRCCPDDACGYIYYDNPLPVVAALVEHEGEVILVQNKGWPSSWFGLVTGFLERDESPEEAVVRELREELGLEGEVASLIGVYDFTMRNEIIIAYHVRARGEAMLGEELAAMKRVAIADLKPWPVATGRAVADWLARRDASLHTARP